jgi:hypothetical protein
MNVSIRPRGPSGRRVFRRCTEPGSSGASRCSTRPYRPSSLTRSAGRPASWTRMFSRTATCVSCPWSARPEGALWLKRHEKRPGGSLFPLGPVLGRLSGSCRSACVEKGRGRAYRWRRRHLCAAARPLSHLVRRRSLPPAILAVGQQTGRERPRPWFAIVFPGRSRGRSRPVCWCSCHFSCDLPGARRDDSQTHPQTRVTRRATRPASETSEPQSDLSLRSCHVIRQATYTRQAVHAPPDALGSREP